MGDVHYKVKNTFVELIDRPRERRLSGSWTLTPWALRRHAAPSLAVGQEVAGALPDRRAHDLMTADDLVKHSWETADDFDDMPRRRWPSAKKSLVSFPIGAPTEELGTCPLWGPDSPFASDSHRSQSQLSQVGTGYTTVMLHKVHSRRSPKFLFDKFAELGFTQDCIDYAYQPMREKGGRLTGTGYMFLNWNTAELAAEFCEAVRVHKVLNCDSPSCSQAVFCTIADKQGIEASIANTGSGLRSAWVRRGVVWARIE